MCGAWSVHTNLYLCITRQGSFFALVYVFRTINSFPAHFTTTHSRYTIAVDSVLLIIITRLRALFPKRKIFTSYKKLNIFINKAAVIITKPVIFIFPCRQLSIYMLLYPCIRDHLLCNLLSICTHSFQYYLYKWQLQHKSWYHPSIHLCL